MQLARKISEIICPRRCWSAIMISSPLLSIMLRHYSNTHPCIMRPLIGFMEGLQISAGAVSLFRPQYMPICLNIVNKLMPVYFVASAVIGLPIMLKYPSLATRYDRYFILISCAAVAGVCIYTKCKLAIVLLKNAYYGTQAPDPFM